MPRQLLWQRLRSCGVSGRMLAAIQALYSDAKIVINISGCVGDSEPTISGVKQGCPPSPTLFGIFIDALEGWLSFHRAPTAGVRQVVLPSALQWVSLKPATVGAVCRASCGAGAWAYVGDRCLPLLLLLLRQLHNDFEAGRSQLLHGGQVVADPPALSQQALDKALVELGPGQGRNGFLQAII